MGCGTGGNQAPAANGTCDDWFRLVPADATVEVSVKPTFERDVMETAVHQRVISSCEGHQDETFGFDGVGVWVSFFGFSHIVQDAIEKSSIRFVPRQTVAWRHRQPIDLAGFIANNHANTVLVVVDMDSDALLGSDHGGQTIRENMIDVIRLAQARGMAIFEVYCAGNRTHGTLINAMTQDADDAAYANHRVFEKPGTGGACTLQCEELVTNTLFTAAVGGFTHAVVMGFDGTICAGKSIFGGWITGRAMVSEEETEVLTLTESYERGLLDLGLEVITSWRVCICGNAGGALSSAYLRYR